MENRTSNVMRSGHTLNRCSALTGRHCHSGNQYHYGENVYPDDSQPTISVALRFSQSGFPILYERFMDCWVRCMFTIHRSFSGFKIFSLDLCESNKFDASNSPIFPLHTISCFTVFCEAGGPMLGPYYAEPALPLVGWSCLLNAYLPPYPGVGKSPSCCIRPNLSR